MYRVYLLADVVASFLAFTLLLHGEYMSGAIVWIMSEVFSIQYKLYKILKETD